jgi:Glycosyl hydrolase family 71
MRRGCGWRRAGARAVSCALAAASLAACALAAPASAQADRATAAAASTRQGGTGNSAGTSIPLFAYYYIWFSHNSWARAKTDLPLIGTYSSSDPVVMRHQIEQAKSAGITGFIVSWKDTPLNDQRLELLMRVAAQEHFKLAMIYEGLDFSRKPLPVSQVAADFVTFRDRFAGNPVFYRVDGKPLTIWSGTWAFSYAQVAQVTSAVRPQLLVLSTEKDMTGFERIAGVTDGDAYYWSSVNPATNTGYGAKLDRMSQAIRRAGKYWIAPFAPGFDARLVGGQRAVPRDNGQTLRTEYAVAVRSSPDMLGLISWNEFSENSYVEPSKNYGYQSLDVLRQLRAVPAAPAGSPAPVTSFSPWPNVLRLLAFTLTLVLGVAALLYLRRRHAHRSQDHSTIPY